MGLGEAVAFLGSFGYTGSSAWSVSAAGIGKSAGGRKEQVLLTCLWEITATAAFAQPRWHKESPDR